jgi:hypothetical protein
MLRGKRRGRREEAAAYDVHAFGSVDALEELHDIDVVQEGEKTCRE